jgi:flagellar hook-associated protein 3
MNKQNDLQEQLSDGLAIHRPSDDPVKAVRSLHFHTSLSMNEQFAQNLSDAQSWMNTTDGVMQDMSTIMNRAKELAVSADGTKSPDALVAVGQEIDGLINHMVTLGNSQIGDRYIFAGQNDKTQPFERRTITIPGTDKTQDVVIYNGDISKITANVDNSKISMPIQAGLASPNQDSVNITGAGMLGSIQNIGGYPTMEFLNHLIEIKNELMQPAKVSQGTGGGGGATVGGTYTGNGYTNFDVKIDSATVAGNVTAASYSIDGGNTWYTATVTSNLPGSPNATISAAAVVGPPSTPGMSGVNITIADDPKNASAATDPKHTYSFRVPRTGEDATDIKWVSEVGLDYIDKDHSKQLNIHTGLGARMSMYTMAANMMDDENTIINSDLAANEDLDVPKAITDFKNAENVYRSALAIGGRIMPTSLVDFLK